MEFITFGPVHLNITDLDRSLRFYCDIIGMDIRKSGEYTELGTTDRTLLVLHQDAINPYKKLHNGLYQATVNIPSETELAQLFVHLAKKGWRAGPTDHIIAKSVYVNDPDGIDIEFTVELPFRAVDYKFTDDEFKVVDDKGLLRSPIEPLDIQELLSHLSDDNSEYRFPSNAIIGHVGLHVPNLRKAYNFYKKLGFTERFIFPRQGWGCLGAGGVFCYRIGLNVWAGKNAPNAPAGSAGLRYFILNYDSQERLEKALRNVLNAEKIEEGYMVEDTAGNKILLTKN